MNGVVIVAAGTGSRMNMGINKQFIKLEGKEIIAYTIEKFYNNSKSLSKLKGNKKSNIYLLIERGYNIKIVINNNLDVDELEIK